jgi:hypothetical protein
VEKGHRRVRIKHGSPSELSPSVRAYRQKPLRKSANHCTTPASATPFAAGRTAMGSEFFPCASSTRFSDEGQRVVKAPTSLADRTSWSRPRSHRTAALQPAPSLSPCPPNHPPTRHSRCER